MQREPVQRVLSRQKKREKITMDHVNRLRSHELRIATGGWGFGKTLTVVGTPGNIRRFTRAIGGWKRPKAPKAVSAIR